MFNITRKPLYSGNVQVVEKASRRFIGLGATYPSVVALVKLQQENFNAKPAP